MSNSMRKRQCLYRGFDILFLRRVLCLIIAISSIVIVVAMCSLLEIKTEFYNNIDSLLRQTENFKPLQTKPLPECWESPYIDCGKYPVRGHRQVARILASLKPPVGYVVAIKQSRHFGAFHPEKLAPDLEHPAPGLSVARTQQGHGGVSVTGNKTYRVSSLYDSTRLDFSHCEFSNCVFSGSDVSSSVDFVVVNGHEFSRSIKPPPRKPGQLFGVTGWESAGFGVHSEYICAAGVPTPEKNANTTAWAHMFNLTMNYRVDSDVFIPYGKLRFVPPDPKANLVQVASNKKKTALWIVSNYQTPSRRNEFVHEMRKYIDVDQFGGYGTLHCTKKPCNGDMNDYRFYLSFENSFCKDYVTEKFFNIFKKGNTVVPVVRGGADYDAYFEPGSFINAAHFNTPAKLALHLKYLSQNDDEYVKILGTKLKYERIVERSDWGNLGCSLCKFLNQRDRSFTRQYNTIGTWYQQCGRHWFR